MYYLDKISLVLMKLICCAAFVFAAYLMICTFKQKNLLLFIVALPVALIASILTVRYFLPGIAEKFTYGLLMPSHHLDKAPIPLSPFYGDLANGAYQKVIREISAAPDCIFSQSGSTVDLCPGMYEFAGVPAGRITAHGTVFPIIPPKQRQ